MPAAPSNSQTEAPVSGAERVQGESRQARSGRKRAPTQRVPGRRPEEGQPPHGVVLHNDDVNTFDFVMACLRRVFGYTAPKAFLLTMRAHATGRAIIWVGMKEHAEFKAEQLTLCGPDPLMRRRGALPLGVSVVPLEKD